MEKYTAIYIESWMSGSRQHSLTKMMRCKKKEDETVGDMLERNGIAESTIFLFNGWPTLQGE